MFCKQIETDLLLAMKEFASEVRGSSDSPDLLSEPPDIRNWFPRYVYESVPLDTSDSLKDLLIDVFEHEEHKALVEESVTDKIRDDELSLRLTSEPPDLRNWISSYTYESPVLDTSDGLTESLFNETKWEKIGGEENNEEEENSEEIRKCSDFPLDIKCEIESSAKVLNSSNSPSFLSEPPNIRNWFTSYAYESPGETVGFGESLSYKRSLSLKTVTQKKKITEDEKNCKRKETCISSGVDYEKNLERKLVDRTRNGSSKVMGEPGLNKGTLLCKLEEESADMKSETRLEEKMQTRTRSPTKKTHVASQSKPKPEACQEPTSVITDEGQFAARAKNGQNSKQMLRNLKMCNDENEIAGTKKNRCGEAKQQESARGIKLKCLRTEESLRLNDTKKRKVLGETTNVQHQSVTEVTGRWVCPQKNKPNKGPPLKQLCLSKWLNRL